MLYFYALMLPIIILVIAYYKSTPTPKDFYGYLTLLFKSFPSLFAYGFFLYFLDMEKYIDTGWSFYSLMFFLVPIAIIVLFLKVFYWFKWKKKAIS